MAATVALLSSGWSRMNPSVDSIAACVAGDGLVLGLTVCALAPAVTGALLIGVLAVSGLVGVWWTGDRRLVTGVFLVCVLGVHWISLAGLESGWPAGVRPLRSMWSPVLIMGLSLVCSAFSVLHWFLRSRGQWRAVRENPDALLGPIEDWPGFRRALGAVGLLLVLVVCYELATAGVWEGRLRCLLVSLGAAMCGASVLGQLSFGWSRNLAEVGLGLVTLSVGAISLLAVPLAAPLAVSEGSHGGMLRYPMTFNAMVVAFAVMTSFWVWIGRVWRQQLDGGEAWTAAGGLAKLIPDFAFFVACLGLVNGSLLALWPRLRPVGVFDDSLGRVSASVAGYLALLLSLLWCSRVTGRTGFRALAALAVVSLAGYVLVRAGPLAPRVHHGALTSATCLWIDDC